MIIKLLVFLVTFLYMGNLLAFNVKDFGAKGDGKTDDTIAIQKALNHIHKRIKYDRFRVEDGWNKGGTETHVDELRFPAGTYLISKTLLANGSISFRGVKGKTILKMTNPDQDLIYCHIYRRFFIDGFILDGGYTQIDVWSNNWNSSTVQIADCTFKNSFGPAFRNNSRRVKMKNPNWNLGLGKVKIKTIPTYTIEYKNEMPILKRSSFENSIAWFSSNIINFLDCKFINCASAFENNADGSLFENCQFIASPTKTKVLGFIRTGSAPNMLTMKNCNFYAPKSNLKQMWFKSDGFYFTLRNCKFTSEQPMALLEQETAKIPHSSTAGNIIIANNTFNQKGNSVPLVIIKRVPSYFLAKGNTFVGKMPKLFDWQVKMTQKYFERDSFPGKHQGVKWHLPNKYQFMFSNNKNINVNTPEIIKQFICKVDPIINTPVPKIAPIPETFKGELKAADFGVIADNKTDNADALEKAMLAASKANKTLILPTGRIRVARTIKLPSKISLRGEGMPVIFGDSRTGYDLFAAENPIDIRFRSLILRLGNHLLKAKLNMQSKYIVIRDCIFLDSSKVSVLLTGENNKCRLDLRGSLWNGSGAIDTQTAFNTVSLCWFANNFWMDNMGFFNARKGTTVMQCPFFVPYVAKGIKYKNSITGEVKVWPLGSKLRWVENFGTNIFMFDTRGGGEAGGYCLYTHAAPGGTAFIEGGIARMTNKDTINATVYAKAAPKWIVAAALGGYPIHTVLGVRHRVWIKEKNVKDFPMYVIGNMTPQELHE